MVRKLLTSAALVLALLTSWSFADSGDHPPELAPFVMPLNEIESMMADGTYDGTDFSAGVSSDDAAKFAREIKAKLRLANTEYSRLPRKFKSSKLADDHWYRMDAFKDTAEGFSAALQRHASGATQNAAAPPKSAASASHPALQAVVVPLAKVDALLGNGTFDGKDFAADVSFEDATGFSEAYRSEVKAASNAFRTLPSDAMRDPDYAGLADQLNARIQQSNAFNEALRRHKAVVETAAAATIANGEANALSPELAPLGKSMARIDAQLANGAYDGTDFDLTVSTDEATSFFNSFVDEVNAATRTFKTVPPAQQRTTEGRALFKQLNERIKLARAMKSALNRHSEERKEFEAADAAMGADDRLQGHVDTLQALLDDPKIIDRNAFAAEVPIAEAEIHAKAVSAATTALEKELSNPDTSAELRASGNKLWNDGRRFRNAYTRHRSAVLNAEAGARSAAIAKQVAAREAQRQAEREAAAAAQANLLAVQAAERKARDAAAKAERAAAAGVDSAAMAAGVDPEWRNSFIPNPIELKDLDGYFAWPWSEPSWQAVQDKAAEQVAAGKLSEAQVAMFEKAVASEWPAAPRTEDAGDAQYIVDMLEQRLKGRGVEVLDVWMSRANWKIQRNALGAIISRTKPGYLIYKDPGGTGCILRQWYFKEQYAGGSNYEPASGWRYSRLRFQDCDRR